MICNFSSLCRCTELEILLKLNQMKTVSDQDQRYRFLCHCLAAHSPSPRFCHWIFLSLSVCHMNRLSIILVHSKKKLGYWSPWLWKYCNIFSLQHSLMFFFINLFIWLAVIMWAEKLKWFSLCALLLLQPSYHSACIVMMMLVESLLGIFVYSP